MRHFLKTSLAACAVVSFAGVAEAADVIYEEPAMVAPMAPMEAAPYSWTGGYIGLFGGAATGDFDYDFAMSPAVGGIGDASLENSAGGLFGGAQAGYDYQIGNFVIGAVADIAASDIDTELTASIGGVGSASVSSDLQYLGTVRARLGYAMDRFMVYGHGGFAYGETEQTVSLTGLGSVTNDENDTKTGYVVGAGVEYAIFDNVSFQTEYSYTDLGDDTILSGTVGGTDFSVDESLDFHAVKAAINYRF